MRPGTAGRPNRELCARSGLATRLEAKQLVGAKGKALAYRPAWRYPETASSRDGPPGQGVHMDIPAPMHVCKAILCDTFSQRFGSDASLTRCFASGRPAESAGLPAQSPSLLGGTSHKTRRGRVGKSIPERSETMPAQGTRSRRTRRIPDHGFFLSPNDNPPVRAFKGLVAYMAS